MEGAQNKQAGFNIVELLVIVVAVGVIGVGGWFVYQHNRTKVTQAAGGTSTTTQQTTTPTPQPTVTYLDIKEWGVKLALSESIKDAYYVVSTASSKDADGLPGTVWLGLTSITDQSCNPANNNVGKAGALGAILRIPLGENDAVTGQPLTQEYPNGVVIGSYYYAYASSTNGKTCAPAATLQSVDSAFSAAAKSTVTTAN